MPAVHVLMINSSQSTQISLLGKIFGFLAEGPGAQLFMLLMGMSFTFSRKKNLRNILFKAFILLCAAYTLNFLKFDILMLIGKMPQSFLDDYQIENNGGGMLKLFLLGDILHLAGLSLLIIGIVYLLPKYYLWSAMLALIIIFISPVNLSATSENAVIKHLSDLLFAHSNLVYFPVFPWLCYPLTGLCLGYYFFRIQHFFRGCRNTGIVLMVNGKLFCLFHLTSSCDNFYRTGAGGTLYHLGFVLFWLYLIHLAINYLPLSRFFSLLQWLSRNITAIYIVQWICIFWMINIGGYQRLNIVSSIIYMFLMTVFVFAVTYLTPQLFFKNYRAKRKVYGRHYL